MEDRAHDLVLTRAASRRVDELAVRELGIPSIVLMENAGANAARAIEQRLARDGGRPGPVVVLCGGGNNGGDGCVVARQLALGGHEVVLEHARSLDELQGDARVQRTIVERLALPAHTLTSAQGVDELGARWRGARLLVDAVLGTGFSGTVREPCAGWLRALEHARAEGGAPLVALDLPSGLDADTGQADPATPRADLTITFFSNKLGLTQDRAREFSGTVIVAPIGAPLELAARMS